MIFQIFSLLLEYVHYKKDLVSRYLNLDIFNYLHEKFYFLRNLYGKN